MLVSWQQQHAALMQRYCVILYCGQSQCKCSDCTISDIFHHHCFLYFSSTAPLPPPPCAPPGLPPIRLSPLSQSGTARGPRDIHNTAAAAVPTQAINTAAGHLKIYVQPWNPHCGRIIWQGATRVNPKQPRQLIRKITCLLSSVRPQHFFFLPFSFILLSVLFLMSQDVVKSVFCVCVCILSGVIVQVARVQFNPHTESIPMSGPDIHYQYVHYLQGLYFTMHLYYCACI